MTAAPHPARSGRNSKSGVLLAVEGINGVGKNYLVRTMLDQWQGKKPVELDEFSARLRDDQNPSLDRMLVRALRAASGGDYFFRGGSPGAETMAILAIKAHDYESVLPLLEAGEIVIEGRGIVSTAALQGAVFHPDDPDAALAVAKKVIATARVFRPMPDRTIIVSDDLSRAIGRAGGRDKRVFPPDEQQLLQTTDVLYKELAAAYPDEIAVLDLRTDWNSRHERFRELIDESIALANVKSARRESASRVITYRDVLNRMSPPG